MQVAFFEKSTVNTVRCGFFYSIFAVIFFSFSTADKASAQEVIWQDSLSYDFGEISQNHPVTHTFHFTNMNTDTIDIETVRSDCGCTETDWTKEEIPPGSAGKVIVIFDSKHVGPFKKKVRVYFRQFKKAHILHISGKVL